MFFRSIHPGGDFWFRQLITVLFYLFIFLKNDFVPSISRNAYATDSCQKKYSRTIEPYNEVYIAVLCAVFQECCCGVLNFIHPEGNFRFRQIIAINVFQTIIGFQP